jgi:NitT/TauT family transport system substrate-binding protein
MIAGEKGFFSAEGLDVAFLKEDLSKPHAHGWTSGWLMGPSGPVRNDAMVVEYPVLQDMVSGAMDYYVVAGEHSGCRQLVVPVGSSIRSAAELRGKRVGLRPTEDTLMWEFLIGSQRPGGEPTRFVHPSFASGDPREVQWVTEQFAANQIAAYGGADPVPEILIADGVARRLASNTWTPPLNGWYCCMLAVRKELVDAHPDLPRRFTRAMRAAASFVEKNPAEAVAYAVTNGHLPPSTRQDLSARLLREYVWTTTGRIQEDLERYFQLLIDAGRIRATTPPAELVKRVYRGAEA